MRKTQKKGYIVSNNKGSFPLYIFDGINKMYNIEDFIKNDTFIDNGVDCYIIDEDDTNIKIGKNVSVNEQFLIDVEKSYYNNSDIIKSVGGYNGPIIVNKDGTEFVITNSINVLHEHLRISGRIHLINMLDTL